ncbi:MAG: ATPase, partial [Micromonosporaceae bacterium]|nr:ATPase [Micromonosporaceae bacterium]
MQPSATTTDRTAPNSLVVAVRLGLLGIVAGLTLAATRDLGSLRWIGPLAAVAGLATLADRHQWLGPLTRLVEVVAAGLAGSAVAAAADAAGTVPAGYGANAVLPYLVVAPVLAGGRRRAAEATVLLVAGAGTLAAAGALTTVDGARQLTQAGYVWTCLQWLLLATLAAALAGALSRSLLAAVPPPQPYAEATRLLTQLRSVARQLPGATLDPGGIAEHLLDEVRAEVPVNRAAVLTASGGGRLVVLAQSGADRVDWETALDADSAVADAWASQQPQTEARSQTRSHAGSEVSSLVLPLVSGVRTIGLVAVESDTAAAYPPVVVNRVQALAAPAALRLEAALLFDEVRSLA